MCKKNCKAGLPTDDKTAHAHFMLYIHSQYVILISFRLQQCLGELASLLRYMYIACLVYL